MWVWPKLEIREYISDGIPDTVHAHIHTWREFSKADIHTCFWAGGRKPKRTQNKLIWKKTITQAQYLTLKPPRKSLFRIVFGLRLPPISQNSNKHMLDNKDHLFLFLFNVAFFCFAVMVMAC